METKRISELPSNDGTLNGNELLEVATMPSTGTQTVASKKSLLSEIGKWIFGRLHNSRLLTQNKTIIGAINEIKNAETGEPGSGAAHNAVYRGKCLGPAPTAEQYEAIRNNTFDDMYVGDYWYDENEGIHWRIAGFNYYHGACDPLGSSPTKITNYHVVIVPDEPIVDDTFVNEQGELRITQLTASPGQASKGMSTAWGYKYDTGKIVIDEQPPVGTSKTLQFEIPYDRTVANTRLTCWIDVSTIPDGNGGFLPTTNCLVRVDGGDFLKNKRSETQTYILDCYCVDYTTRLYNYDLTIIQIPDYPDYVTKGLYYTKSLPNLPVGTELFYDYSYHEDGYGAMDEAVRIITNKFGDNHIIPFCPYVEAQGKKADLLSTEQLTGNGSLSCIGEFGIYEHDQEAMSIILDQQNFNNRNKFHYAFCSRRQGYGSAGFSEVPSSKLPLFTFNPSLIHTGYNYWLKSFYSNSSFIYFSNSENFITRFIAMDENGNQVADTDYGQRPGTGIRPYFLLSYTSSPNSNS